MTVQEETPANLESKRPLVALEDQLTRLLYLDGERLAYIVIFIIAVLTRFWDLGARVMSHDESLHTRYSWGLFKGEGYAHTPLMHGPVLFHMVALSYLLFGDNDFTARIYPAILGIIIVMTPILLRKWLGKLGAISTSILLLISPLILYYSRYIREDIPAITGALIMVIAIWKYIEQRHFRYLVWLGFGQFLLFASKEVSFIYIAIFGSCLTLYFITRLLDVDWESRSLYNAFVITLAATLIVLTALGAAFAFRGDISALLAGAQTAPPSDTLATAQPVDILMKALLILLGGSIITLIGVVMAGQWRNLRRLPELDVMVVMGTFILPPLTPFLIQFAGYDPTDETPQGIMRSFVFTLAMIIVSVIIGVIWGSRPPGSRLVTIPAEETRDGKEETIEVAPDAFDWLQSLLTSRWWAIGGLYWILFIFFFTTMFTNGNGLGTGIIGSLAYWLKQQDVQRGSQPIYYYVLVMLPVYEFMPVILSLAAGVIGLGKLLRSLFNKSQEEPAEAEEADATTQSEQLAEETAPPPARKSLDLDAPISFPALPFTAYWAVTMLIALSIAGEKMPWLTTHLTTPLILLGGWVAGRLLERIEWRRLWPTQGWVLFVLLPILVIALTRVVAPLCALWPTNLLCNTVIPESYKVSAFQGMEVSDLSATSVWLAALIALGATLAGVIIFGARIGARQVLRLGGLLIVGGLAFLTARAAWWAAFVNYDEATEFLVYAHSSGAVKEVLGQIEEISLKTTDGYGLRVAYDNKVSWPYSWYLRNYYNAIYYADQPSRGVIGDAPVILAGPENWPRVEPLLGDRYYRFEYIRMWWPMQDYFSLKEHPEFILGFFSNPAMQRGVWEIFYKRDYTAYGQAIGQSFELNQWPLADRMRVYIRKDVFAQVWDYGVAASQAAESIDPYAQNVRQLTPDLTFGQGLLNRPHQIAIGPDNLIYVADSSNHRIAVFDVDGNLIRTFGTYGLAPTPEVVNEPWGVSVAPDGRVYVADTWNHRIVEYTPEGEYITNWGFEGPNIANDPLAFWGPRAITVDPQSLVYLADTGNKRIQVFDPQGLFVRQIGSGGNLDGQLDEPVGLAIGSDGLLYVADTWNQRVEVFTTEGQFVRQWPVEAWFAQTNERPYLALDAQNNVYVTDPEAFRVIVFSSIGRFLYSFGDYTTIGLAGGIAINSQGQLFLSDTAAGTIQRYDMRSPHPPMP